MIIDLAGDRTWGFIFSREWGRSRMLSASQTHFPGCSQGKI
ncbi:hypothetical protein [Cylindrospermopsis raciborskii]|nr:hypothetical protein [Cylindrospermopsis raciborskii]MCZ2207806.1 hypothetical protein [Cylindrospermopsis raciborskii PAMP2011]